MSGKTGDAEKGVNVEENHDFTIPKSSIFLVPGTNTCDEFRRVQTGWREVGSGYKRLAGLTITPKPSPPPLSATLEGP